MDFFANDISSILLPSTCTKHSLQYNVGPDNREDFNIYTILPDEVVYQNVRDPEVLDDIGVDVDLPPRPVRAVVENHPVLRPPHVVSQPQADLLHDKSLLILNSFLLTFTLFYLAATEKKVIH